jgi:hypothetical protein
LQLAIQTPTPERPASRGVNSRLYRLLSVNPEPMRLDVESLSEIQFNFVFLTIFSISLIATGIDANRMLKKHPLDETADAGLMRFVPAEVPE